MSNTHIFITVVLAFFGFGSFTQIDTAFADKRKANTLFTLLGIAGVLGTIAMFIFGRTPSA